MQLEEERGYISYHRLHLFLKNDSNDYERDCLFTGLQKDLRGHPFQHSSWTGKSEHGAFQMLSAVSS